LLTGGAGEDKRFEPQAIRIVAGPDESQADSNLARE
jgi:hypothetical protein